MRKFLLIIAVVFLVCVPETFAQEATPPRELHISSPSRVREGSSFELTFAVDDEDPVAVSYEVNIDGGGWKSVTSPLTLVAREQGTYHIVLRATHLVGNVLERETQIVVQDGKIFDFFSRKNKGEFVLGQEETFWKANPSIVIILFGIFLFCLILVFKLHNRSRHFQKSIQKRTR